MDWVLLALAVLLAQGLFASQWHDGRCAGALAVVAAVALVRAARGRPRRWSRLVVAAAFVAAAGSLARPSEAPWRGAADSWRAPAGAWWSGEAPPAQHIEELLEGETSTGPGYNVRGRVIDVAPSSAGGVRLAVEVEDVAGDRETPRAATGVVSVSIRHGASRWYTGERVAFRSRLRRLTSYGNFAEFDWASYNARRGIFVSAYAWQEHDVRRLEGPRSLIDRVRAAMARACDEVGGQGAAVLEALTTGDRFRLSGETSAALRDAGLAHFLAISGSHMVLVAALAAGLVRWALGRSAGLVASYDVARPAALAGAAAVVGYAAITGGGVSVTRSVLMALASLAALWRGRPGDELRALGGSALVLALALPGVGEEAGFQLSYVAVAGLIAYGRHRRVQQTATCRGQTPPPGRTCRGQTPAPLAAVAQRPGWARRGLDVALEGIRIAVVCWMVTSPIVAQHFARVSLVAPVSNLLAAPLVGAVVVCGLAAVAAEPVWPFLQHLLVLAGAGFGQALVLVARAAAWLPFAALAVPVPGPLLTMVLVSLPFAVLLASGRGRARALAALGAIALFAIATGLYQRYRNDRLDVWFASVGQGDAAVLRMPGGKVVVIDAGPGAAGRMVLEPLLRRLWIGRIDVLVASHLQYDHAGAFPELLGAFDVGELWVPAGEEAEGIEQRAATAASVVAAASRHGVALLGVAGGTAALLGPRAGIEVLAPDAAADGGVNDRSIVMAVEFAGRRLLFTGDIEASAERALLQAGAALRADVLKVPHHGSRTSSTQEFVDAVAPVVAVASVGLDNRYGFPGREVEQRYVERGIGWLRTDEVGAVHVAIDAGAATDGSQAAAIAVETARPRPLRPAATLTPWRRRR